MPSNIAETIVGTAARRREPVTYSLLAVGVLFIVVTIYWGLRWNSEREPAPTEPGAEQTAGADEKKKERIGSSSAGDYLAGAVWSGLLAGIFLAAGGWNATRQMGTGAVVHDARVLFMALGGSIGALTALLGLALAWRWQKSIVQWISQGETEEAKWVLASLAIVFVGLALLFASMQLGRAEERSSLLIRRMMYGSNSVLSGLLLVLVLAAVNVAVAVKLPDNVITTSAAFQGLSDESRELLRTINEPVKIYLVMPESFGDDVGMPGLFGECKALLRACEDRNSHIMAVFLTPATDMEEIRRTQERLEIPKDQRGSFGFMIGYGNDEKPSGFIPAEGGLVQETREGRRLFHGEARLMTELNFLSGGAKRPVVYFTQGNLEPSLTGPTRDNPRSCKEIARYLTERKFDVKPLLLEPDMKIDLTDANMIVIAGPRTPFRRDQIELLRRYLFPPRPEIPGGKVLAFLPAVRGEKGQVAPTELEGLFADFGVQVEPRRLFTLPRSLPQKAYPPDVVMATVSPILQRYLPEGFRVRLGNVRPVSAGQAARPDQSVQPLMFSYPRVFVYQDSNYDSDPLAIDELILKEEEQGKLQTFKEKKVSPAAPIGALVAERLRQEQGGSRVRLAVIGSDWFVDDAVLSQASLGPESYTQVLTLLIEMIRDRPEAMKIEPRAIGVFNLDKDVNEDRLFWLPLFLSALAICGLGVGVWMARRR